jgi:hypothetical protein
MSFVALETDLQTKSWANANEVQQDAEIQYDTDTIDSFCSADEVMTFPNAFDLFNSYV